MFGKWLCLAALALCSALPAHAGEFDDVVHGTVRPGWRLPNGDHMAALHLQLAPGWKTYWRAPGEGGIPPEFNWSGSRNLAAVAINWPTPEVFDQAGMRSIGYENELVLPIRITPRSARTIDLRGEMTLGLCKDICLPHTLSFRAQLPSDTTRPDPVIAASLANVPYTEDEAGVRGVSCDLRPSQDGLTLTARVQMPSTGTREHVVIETANPMIWVQETTTRRKGRELHAVTTLMHMEGKPFAVDRTRLTLTVIGRKYAVEIQGCGR